MSDLPNIEVFNIVAAKTLVRLYEAFPTPIAINPIEIGMEVVLEEKYDSEGPHHAALVSSGDSVIQFLVAENFIRSADGPRYTDTRGFQNLVLTSKGLALLQKVPEAVDETLDRRSNFEKLKAAFAAGTRTTAVQALGPVITRLLGAV